MIALTGAKSLWKSQLRCVSEVSICMSSIMFCRNRNCGGKLDNVVGYTDGSLFKIRKPSVENNCQAFIGRKNFPCINAQIVSITPLFSFGHKWQEHV